MKAESSFLLDDTLKGSLRAEDLYDRIIDLCFHYKDSETGKINRYILRSDFDFDPATGGIYKCVYKPSISLKYQKLNGNSDISVDLSIDNFYMYTKGGRIVRNLVSATGTLVGIDIAIGYFNQFNKPAKAEDLFDFNKSTGQGVCIMSTSSLYVETKGDMPELNTVIHCVFGNSTVTNIKTEEPKEPDYSSVISDGKNSTDIELILKQYITDRFLNMSRMVNDDSAMVQYNEARKNNTVTPKNLIASYGVPVHLTKKAKELKIPNMSDSSGNSQSTNIHISPSGCTIRNSIYKINRQFGLKLCYVTLQDGSILVYDKEEEKNIKSIAEEAEKSLQEYSASSLFSNYWNNHIPAIYSMSIDAAVSIINCPFFAFIQPFTKVKFSTQYGNTGKGLSIVRDANAIEFVIVTVNIEFSTVDDVNKMVLQGITDKRLKG